MNIEVITDSENLKYIIKSFDIVVDAIYGTGIHGSVSGISYDVIEEINASAKYVMSVDIPSGINADSGEICGVCIKADKTVTFAAYKIGMLMFPGADYVGNVKVCDISIPDYILEGEGISVKVTDKELVRELGHQALHDIRGAIGTVVVDDEDIESHREVEDISDDLLDILLLLVGRDDD